MKGPVLNGSPKKKNDTFRERLKRRTRANEKMV